jgi:hypothetical protein
MEAAPALAWFGPSRCTAFPAGFALRRLGAVLAVVVTDPLPGLSLQLEAIRTHPALGVRASMPQLRSRAADETTSLDISGALMAKQDRRSSESEQAIPDFDRVEGIQYVVVPAQIILRGNGLEPRPWFKFA